MSTISAGTSAGTALVSTGDTTGALQLQVNGTTPSVTLAANGAFGVGSTPGYGTSGQVLTSAGSGAAPTWATVSAGYTLGTPFIGVFGTSITFTGIPAGTKQVIMTFDRVQVSSAWIVQLGTSAGIVNTGYVTVNAYLSSGQTAQTDNGTTGFFVRTDNDAYSGAFTFTLLSSSAHIFVGSGTVGTVSSGKPTSIISGTIDLPGELTQIRLTTPGGSTSFSSGNLNIAYI